MIDGYIQSHGKRLYGLCLTLCADKQDADDLYQETWLRALSKIDAFDTTRPFEPWITKICVNIYRNQLRRTKLSPVFSGFKSNEEKEAVFASLPAKQTERLDYEPLYRAIDALPDKLRLTVILFYFRDMNIDSAARALGIPSGTAKSRLNKARKLLKEALKDEADLQF